MENLKGIKILTKKEMESVEGGSISLSMRSAYLDKSFCRTKANRLLNSEDVTGMTQQQIAEEIYAHAVAYYKESTFRSVPGVGNRLADYIVDHADPIDIEDGGDSFARKIIFSAVWKYID